MKLSKQFNLYESEATLFLKDLKKNNPHLEESQRLGRARLWDQAPVTLDDQQRALASKVKQKAYVYQSNK